MAVVKNIFPDFASALAACGPGYNDADIADVFAYKTAIPVDNRELAPEQALNSILAVGIAAGEVTSRPLKILDFGGGCGFHYFRVVAAIRTSLQWAIVETPTVASRATKLAQGRFDAFTDIAAAAKKLGRIDLIHASGSIPFTPDPLATLRTLTALRASYFALTRFPLWESAPVVGVQTSALSNNGIGPMPPNISDREILYPITFANIDDVMRTFSEYEIATVLGSPSSMYDVVGQQVMGISLIFRLKGTLPI